LDLNADLKFYIYIYSCFYCVTKYYFYISSEHRVCHTEKIVAWHRCWNVFGTAASLWATETVKKSCSSWWIL